MTFSKIFFVGLLAAGFAVGCSTIDQPKHQEPAYEGRSLSEWLRDFDNSGQPQTQAMAAEAIWHMGAPIVPFLVERLSEAQLKQTKLVAQKWQTRRAIAVFDVPRPPNPRNEAIAALYALGSEATVALPALEKLAHENPPDLRAIFIAARIGSAAVPFLTRSLTNEVKAVRLGAGVCLEMMSSHSEVLYPQIPVGPDAPSFDRQMCEFNLKMLQGAVQVYKAEHPELMLQNGLNSAPPPALPSP
jgi:hypothetical protein